MPCTQQKNKISINLLQMLDTAQSVDTRQPADAVHTPSLSSRPRSAPPPSACSAPAPATACVAVRLQSEKAKRSRASHMANQKGVCYRGAVKGR